MPAQRTTTPRSNKTKSYARQLQNIDSADERTPTLSPNGSVDYDKSSDFDPTFETPSKPGKNDALYVFEDDDDEDMKPDFSDDEISYPGIVTDNHQQESEDEENYGKKGKGKGKGKAQGKTTPRKPRPLQAWRGEVGRSPEWRGYQKRIGFCFRKCIRRYPSPIGRRLRTVSGGMQSLA